MKKFLATLGMVGFLSLNVGIAVAAVTLDTITVGSQTGTLTAGTGSSVTYLVTVAGSYSGSGGSNLNNVVPSVTGLPSGVSFSFSPINVDLNTANSYTEATTLTLTSTNAATAGTTAFTVTNSENAVTGAGSLTIDTAPLTPQTITVNTSAPSSAEYGSTFPVAATSDSGLTVAITTTGGCSISSGTVTMTSATTACVVHYNQSGNSTYAAASEVLQTATASTRSITLTASSNTKTYDGLTTASALPTLTAGTLATGDTATYSENYSTANAGTGLTLVPSIVIKDGSNVDVTANYTVTSVNDTTGIINQAPLTITADNQSKVYGNANPTLTAAYSGFVNGETSAVLSTPVSLSTTATVTTGVGTAPITASGAVGTNYAITHVDGTLTINTRPITITADVQSKAYGDVDPTFTYVVSGSGLVNGDALSGTLTRAAGETVGTYAITQGSLSAGSNYALTYTGTNLTISQIAITVTAQTNTKTYDGANSAAALPTLTSGSLASGDTATYSENYSTTDTGTGLTLVPTVIIMKGSTDVTTSYNVTYVNNTTGVINQAPLIITANNQSKVYGDANPTLTASYSGFVNGETESVFTTPVNLSTTATVTTGIGTTLITATGAVATNYAITHVDGTLTITARPITATADVQSKVYGNTDPTLTYSVTSGNLVNGDTFSGSLTRTAGETVGTYAITQGTLALSSDYALTYTGTNLSITARPITVTATTDTKTYDGLTTASAVPTLTSGTLAGGDGGTYTESYATEGAGTNKTLIPAAVIKDVSDVDVSSNYTITLANNTTGVINQAPLTITANDASKVYGDANPTFTASYVGFVNAETSAVLSTPVNLSTTADAMTGVGTAPITASGAVGTNYAITHVDGTLTITARPVTVTADSVSKVYGDSDPTLTYQVTSGNVANGDPFSGTLTRTTGETVGSYPISQGTLALGSNYTLTYVGSNLSVTARPITVTASSNTKTYDGLTTAAALPTLTSGTLAGGDTGTYAETYASATAGSGKTVVPTAVITDASTVDVSSNYAITLANDTTGVINQAPLTITADDQSKVYGDANPALTASYSGFVNGETEGVLATPVTLSTTADGTTGVGTVAITATGAAATNYAITHVDGTLTITARPITVTADALQKERLSADPTLTYQVTSGNLVNSDIFSGSLTRAAGETVGTYPVTQGTLTLGTNYNLSYVGANFTIVDTTPPTLTSVSIASDNASTTLAKIGDTLTLTFTASEEINMPTVTIAGHSVSVSGTPATAGPFTATYTMVGTDTEGTVAFTVDYSDSAANNLGTQSTSTTDTTSVRFDMTPPTLAITVAPSPVLYNQPTTVTFAFSEMVMNFDNSDIISVDSGTLGTLTTSDNITYTATFTPMNNVLTAGQVIVVGTAWSDSAGNAPIGTTTSAEYALNSNIPVTSDSNSGNGGSTGASGSGSGSTGQVLGAATSTEGTPVEASTSTPAVTSGTGTSKGQVIGASNYAFARDLKVGSRGADVMELQKILWDEGFFKEPEMTTYFGAKTKAALIKWQIKHGIKPAAGYFGKLSRAFLTKQ
jgi:hypothetical protein